MAHVLVAMGPSDSSATALEYAFEEYPDARVSVVHVTDAKSSFGPFAGRDPCEYVLPDALEDNEELLPSPDRFTWAQRRRAERALARAVELANRHGREVEPVVRSGNAAREIVDYAEERAVDRIVIADHPQTTLRPLFRSVPDSVADTSSRPVTTL